MLWVDGEATSAPQVKADSEADYEEGRCSRGREGDRDRTTNGQHDTVKVSKTGEVVKADRGYRLPNTDGRLRPSGTRR
jgi:hypothetical protein